MSMYFAPLAFHQVPCEVAPPLFCLFPQFGDFSFALTVMSIVSTIPFQFKDGSFFPHFRVDDAFNPFYPPPRKFRYAVFKVRTPPPRYNFQYSSPSISGFFSLALTVVPPACPFSSLLLSPLLAFGLLLAP